MGMNMMYGSYHNGYCCGNSCETELVSLLEGSLQNSTWFHRNKGLDHLIFLSHFKIHNNLGKKYRNIFACSRISFERESRASKNRGYQYPSTYVGVQCNNFISDFNNGTRMRDRILNM